MFIRNGDDLYNLEPVYRASRRIEKGETIVILYFCTTDSNNGVTKRFGGLVAEQIWDLLETDSKDVSP